MYSYNMTCYRICVVWWWCFQRSLVREVPTRSPGQEVLAVTVAATALIARKNVSSCIHERFFAKHLANPIPNVAWSTSSPWVNSVGFPLPNSTHHSPEIIVEGNDELLWKNYAMGTLFFTFPCFWLSHVWQLILGAHVNTMATNTLGSILLTN